MRLIDRIRAAQAAADEALRRREALPRRASSSQTKVADAEWRARNRATVFGPPEESVGARHEGVMPEERPEYEERLQSFGSELLETMGRSEDDDIPF